MKILVVDDEPKMRHALKTGIETANHEVLIATRSDEALDLVALHSPQAVILALTLPELDGFEVCRQLREWSGVPIIVTSASNVESDIVRALDLGADDFVVKPVGIGVLLARIRAVMRRVSPDRGPDTPTFSCDDLQIDFSKRLVRVGEKQVHLTPREYDLLRYMAENADRVLTSQHLVRKFWGHESSDGTHALRVHVANLRKKVEREPLKPRFILTETRIGFRFNTSGTRKPLAENSQPLSYR
jgi:two-component system, OmpR family, KDP operon response regulator KdpE